ncbi:LuxR C-terminal-related transcriptional regulator [Rouxiella sp. T17]|uniref:response regulator transcription factor n=1 Tax=Rouxiella sp. T17 TaxID=3085684 RepID=UPI002FC66B9B
MKILIVEPCGFMRLGMISMLIDTPKIDVLDVINLQQALINVPLYKPDIILINMTQHCHCAHINPDINAFLKFRRTSKIYCYLDANYPDNDEPIMVAENFLMLRKQRVEAVFEEIIAQVTFCRTLQVCTQPFSIYSDQELLVLNDWMAEVPNYRIARKLNISNRTVYVHKRHITQKIKVRNRLEFCFIYNIIKYFYWPINPSAQRPLSRQTKEDILALIR